MTRLLVDPGAVELLRRHVHRRAGVIGGVQVGLSRILDARDACREVSCVLFAGLLLSTMQGSENRLITMRLGQLRACYNATLRRVQGVVVNADRDVSISAHGTSLWQRRPL